MAVQCLQLSGSFVGSEGSRFIASTLSRSQFPWMWAAGRATVCSSATRLGFGALRRALLVCTSLSGEPLLDRSSTTL